MPTTRSTPAEAMLTAARPRPLVYRTSTHDDALISPFLLDASSVTLLTKHSHRRFQGTWLHMPVMVRLVRTREHALRHVNYLSRLRHPNLEQFLGAVVNPSAQKAIITEFVNGKSISEILQRSSLTPAIALTVALDVARALVYLHATTGRPHGGVRPESVLYDHSRCRAVVLLSTKIRTGSPCAAPEARGSSVGKEADVYSLAALLISMFQNIHNVRRSVRPSLVRLLPRRLHGVVWSALQEDVKLRPSIEELCQALVDCQCTFG